MAKAASEAPHKETDLEGFKRLWQIKPTEP
jgi:hypothetical protein